MSSPASASSVVSPTITAAANAGAAVSSDAPARILIASHSHPMLSKGGAEIAAYQLFKSLSEHPGYEASFLGCVRDQMNQKLGATISQPFTEREYLYSTGGFDWFKFSNPDSNFPKELRALLRDLRPNIFHFHHYINFGVEAFLHVKEALPDCKIVVTLHEYLALCHHFGQMVTKQNKTLCYEATPLRCTSCFKDITPSDFFLRNAYIHRFFELVDHFISPSHFLAERYIKWGIPAEKMSVIENVIPHPVVDGIRGAVGTTGERSGPLRIGFFGQVSFLKGINVLFEAAEILEERECYDVVFEIFGDHSGQPPEFQADFLSRLAKVGRNVKFHGPYDQNRVDQLMRSVDAILMPSIWWENSPVVIQEAMRNRRPIICSDIGGMAEKVRDGQDGFHFPVGNSVALASLLLKLVDSQDTMVQLAESMQYPPAADHIVQCHEELYARLLSSIDR